MTHYNHHSMMNKLKTGGDNVMVHKYLQIQPKPVDNMPSITLHGDAVDGFSIGLIVGAALVLAFLMKK